MTGTEIRERFSYATTRHELLSLLNRIKEDELGERAYPFTMAQLNYFCNSSNTGRHYRLFGIPKKSGGVRMICAPEKMLKSMLSCVNTLLQAIYTPSASATGFIPGRSVVDNAAKHTGRLYVFNSDLRDFFPSISKNRVRAALMVKPICASREMADALANLCCAKIPFRGDEMLSRLEVSRQGTLPEGQLPDIFYRDFLPQGSPASPAMTNIICRHMDWQMERLAAKYGCTYSRYADDMTFSCDRSVFSRSGDFYREFCGVVDANGFTLNEDKTRVQKKGCRQEVTGLTVGEKVNVSKAYVRDLTNVLHIWEKYGYSDAASKYFAFHKDVQRPFSEKPGVAVSLENIIRGKINYLRMVKGAEDPVYLRLRARFDALAGKTDALMTPGYTYTTILRIPKFEKVMNCSVVFDSKRRMIRGEEYDYAFGRMEIYGKPVRAYLGGHTARRLKDRYGRISAALLDSFRDRLFISRCYSSLSRIEFWLITDCRPYSRTDAPEDIRFDPDSRLVRLFDIREFEDDRDDGSGN